MKTGNKNILIVDDSSNTRDILRRNLESKHYVIFAASNITEALKILNSTHIALVLTDIKMPGENGLDLVRYIKENLNNTEAIVITGYPSVPNAVQAIKIGAEEYLTKPFTDKELFDAVQHAFNKLSTRKKINKNLDKKVNFKSEFIGESSQIEKVYYAISKAADTIATVLITGESGTGKELIARAIHYNSKRASAPFMPINCGGIPNELFESELFGYKKGAFTGASETRKGFFQAAEGGTIFLDEISEMTLPMQVKILRALQEKEIFMVGDRRGEKTDVRVIAATNKDLLSLINKGLFREDLYFRLNILSIEIPPLRNRTGDIPLLINFFNKKISEEQTKPLIKFSDRAIRALQNYYWPGNVRELENVIQRIAIMNDDKIIEVSDLPLLMRFSTLRKTALNKTLAEVEKEYITNVLAGANGNKSKAAKILGIDRKTLRTKLNKIVDSEKY